MSKSFTLEFFQKAGRQGGKAKSTAKAAAARENGRKGGKPRKDKSATKERARPTLAHADPALTKTEKENSEMAIEKVTLKRRP